MFDKHLVTPCLLTFSLVLSGCDGVGERFQATVNEEKTTVVQETQSEEQGSSELRLPSESSDESAVEVKPEKAELTIGEEYFGWVDDALNFIVGSDTSDVVNEDSEAVAEKATESYPNYMSEEAVEKMSERKAKPAPKPATAVAQAKAKAKPEAKTKACEQIRLCREYVARIENKAAQFEQAEALLASWNTASFAERKQLLEKKMPKERREIGDVIRKEFQAVVDARTQF